MNYLDIQNNFLIVTPYKNDISEIADGLTQHIISCACEHMSVDLSALSMFDAIRVSSVCSAFHFSKYPFGSLEWVVKDFETKNAMRALTLKTVKVSIKRPILKNIFDERPKKIMALR